MPSEQRLGVGAAPATGWFEVRDRLAPTHDREMLAVVLDRVEEICEVAGGVGRGHIGHEIRLSDNDAGRDPLDGVEAGCRPCANNCVTSSNAPSDRHLLGPAYIELEADGTGRFRFIAVEGHLDVKHADATARPRAEFTWEGDDDGCRVPPIVGA
jgi:hypothetical protein